MIECKERMYKMETPKKVVLRILAALLLAGLTPCCGCGDEFTYGGPGGCVRGGSEQFILPPVPQPDPVDVTRDMEPDTLRKYHPDG